jgi:hypothetical protein
VFWVRLERHDLHGLEHPLSALALVGSVVGMGRSRAFACCVGQCFILFARDPERKMLVDAPVARDLSKLGDRSVRLRKTGFTVIRPLFLRALRGLCVAVSRCMSASTPLLFGAAAPAGAAGGAGWCVEARRSTLGGPGGCWCRRPAGRNAGVCVEGSGRSLTRCDKGA